MILSLFLKTGSPELEAESLGGCPTNLSMLGIFESLEASLGELQIVSNNASS